MIWDQITFFLLSVPPVPALWNRLERDTLELLKNPVSTLPPPGNDRKLELGAVLPKMLVGLSETRPLDTFLTSSLSVELRRLL